MKTENVNNKDRAIYHANHLHAAGAGAIYRSFPAIGESVTIISAGDSEPHVLLINPKATNEIGRFHVETLNRFLDINAVASMQALMYDDAHFPEWHLVGIYGSQREAISIAEKMREDAANRVENNLGPTYLKCPME